MSAHTPGPWSAWAPEDFDTPGKWQIDANSGPLCPRPKIATIHSGIAYKNDKSAVAARMEANARLIAAAPDMYEALKAASHAVDELCAGQHPDNECWNTLRAIRAALAKAEGAQ